IHGLCRRHATKAETIRLRGKWIEVDPRGWKKRSDLTIGVGLGNSDQRMKLQGIQMLMNEQKAQIQLTGGKSVSPMNLY
ncbi:portal protein, partial [Streptococcus pneumoniae]|uniref:portal protein n=1 Tax=Streptococcus pneumoniae TaxID=1313 RepID=UPI001E2FFB29